MAFLVCANVKLENEVDALVIVNTSSSELLPPEFC